MEVEELITEIGTYPETWTIDRVDSVFDLIQGKQVSERNRIGDNQRPFLRTKNVFWNRLELAELDQMHFSAPEEARYALLPGDLLLCEGGDVGRTAMWRGEVERCYIQNHLHRLRAFDGMVDPQYAVFWFWYAFNVGNLYIGRGNKTTIPNMSRSKLAELQIALPPLPEQQRIAQVLSTVQEAIAQQERLIRTTTELKQALMQKLFTEGLRGEALKETEIGRVPESWEVVPLQSVCELIIDCPHTTPTFLSEGVRVARNFNIRDGRFVPEPAYYTSEEQYRERVRRAVPEPGDVLFSREAPVGEACVIPAGMRLSLGQRTMLLRPDKSRLRPDFLVYSFYSPVLSAYMKSIASGLTVAHLNVADVRSLPLPLPTIEVQEGITDTLLSIERKGEHHRTKLTALQDLFRTLLHELMTGKVRVGATELQAQ